MNNDIAEGGLLRIRRVGGRAATGVCVLAVRACALVLFMVMAMAEPFLAVVFSALALGCFCVAVLFGFILHAPFQHRWHVLGAAVAFMMLYVAYRFAMQGVERLLR